jgi:hypothetical protein
MTDPWCLECRRRQTALPSDEQTNNNPISLRDGIVSRVQLVAVIRWRIFWARFGYYLLLLVSVIAAVAAVISGCYGAPATP